MDSLVNFRKAIDSSKILSTLNASNEYGLMTFHRPSNVDYLDNLKELIKTISLCMAKDLQIILPLHPRTKKSIINNNLWDAINNIENLIITDSLG